MASTAFQYPCSASGTRFSNALIPRWVMADSTGKMLANLRLRGGPEAMLVTDSVSDRKLMPAEQFVHCSSGLVADTFGLCDRGYLRNGYVADIVVFDPEEYAPEASYENPTEYSEGIEQLIISGTVVVDNGYTSELPGQVLLREQCN